MSFRPVVRPVARAVARAVNSKTGFSPLELFANGEQGAWYDPSDLSTLYQDAAGTIPVTADGDPVGRMLDKSPNGNHATQSVAASRPVYQRGDSRGVVNLLRWSEDFSNSEWTTSGANKGTGITDNPFGITAPHKVTQDGQVGVEHQMRAPQQTHSTQLGLSLYVKSNGTRYVELAWQGITGDPALENRRAIFDLVAATVDTQPSYSPTASITPAGDGWFLISLITLAPSAAVANQYHMFLLNDSKARIYTGDGVSGVFLHGAQLETGTTPTPYQRNDSHLGGVATGSAGDLHWLEADGVDDQLDLPAVAGVQYISAAAARAGGSEIRSYLVAGDQQGVHFSISANHGAFNKPNELLSSVNDTNTHVVTVLPLGVAGEYFSDGISEAAGTLNSMTLSRVFSRTDTAFRFGGRMYGMVIVDADKSSSRGDVESYLAKKSGVTLP